jgi:hypothetical protein
MKSIVWIVRPVLASTGLILTSTHAMTQTFQFFQLKPSRCFQIMITISPAVIIQYFIGMGKALLIRTP